MARGSVANLGKYYLAGLEAGDYLDKRRQRRLLEEAIASIPKRGSMEGRLEKLSDVLISHGRVSEGLSALREANNRKVLQAEAERLNRKIELNKKLRLMASAIQSKDPNAVSRISSELGVEIKPEFLNDKWDAVGRAVTLHLQQFARNGKNINDPDVRLEALKRGVSDVSVAASAGDILARSAGVSKKGGKKVETPKDRTLKSLYKLVENIDKAIVKLATSGKRLNKEEKSIFGIKWDVGPDDEVRRLIELKDETNKKIQLLEEDEVLDQVESETKPPGGGGDEEDVIDLMDIGG